MPRNPNQHTRSNPDPLVVFLRDSINQRGAQEVLFDMMEADPADEKKRMNHRKMNRTNMDVGGLVAPRRSLQGLSWEISIHDC